MRSVSVIVPFHGDLGLLDQCLRSLAAQTYPRDFLEVLAVDNGTPSDLSPLLARFPDVRWLREERPGSYAARNRGIAAADGDVIAFTDSDCRPTPAWIEEGVRALEALPANLVGGRVDYLAPGRPLNTYEIIEELIFLLGNQRFLVERQNIAATANILAERGVIERVGAFDPDFTTFGDGAWTMQAVARGEVLRYADAAVVQHPRRSNWSALLGKARRVAGGKLVVMKKARQPGTAFVADLFRHSVLDPRTHLLPFRPRALAPGRRMHLLLVIEALSLACTFEKLQVHCGRWAYRG